MWLLWGSSGVKIDSAVLWLGRVKVSSSDTRGISIARGKVVGAEGYRVWLDK